MLKKERVLALCEILDKEYPDVRCSLNYSTPLQMLIATQLSAQCTDAKVNAVTEGLFKKYKTVYDFANADLLELQNDIRSIGLFRNKAKNIIACCNRLIDCYGGEVPSSMDELLTLPGTGRKTANLVLGDIFHKPAVVVDTHCMRLSQRIGITRQTTPEKIELDLKKSVPPACQLRLCHQLVNHGRKYCTARSPKCDICPVLPICRFGSGK